MQPFLEVWYQCLRLLLQNSTFLWLRRENVKEEKLDLIKLPLPALDWHSLTIRATHF